MFCLGNLLSCLFLESLNDIVTFLTAHLSRSVPSVHSRAKETKNVRIF
jgi:hypothetical protein